MRGSGARTEVRSGISVSTRDANGEIGAQLQATPQHRLSSHQANAVASTARQIHDDVPITRRWNGNSCGQTAITTAVICCPLSPFVLTEVRVIHHKNVALVRAIHHHDITCVHVLSRMNGHFPASPFAIRRSVDGFPRRAGRSGWRQRRSIGHRRVVWVKPAARSLLLEDAAIATGVRAGFVGHFAYPHWSNRNDARAVDNLLA